MKEDLVKKYHLEEARKRFQEICEYTFITKPNLDEDGPDDDNMGGQDNGDAMGAGPQNGMEDGGGQPQGMQEPQNGQPQDMGGGDFNGNGGMQPQDGPGANGPMGPDDNGGAPDDMGGGPDDMGGPESMDGGPDEMGGVDDGMETSEMQPDDEVIDVDDLTNSQETTEYKVDGVDDKLTKLLAVTDKFIDALKNNDEKIENLKAEFERRNPSDEEKLNIRSQASSPYTFTPKDYWENKKATDPRYNVMFNNDVSPAEEEMEYVIKDSDIEPSNSMDMLRSFSLNDFIGDLM